MSQQGKAPKNHMRDNLKEIRSKQRENREKEEEEKRPKPAPFKLNKFKNVESKLTTTGLKYDA